MLASLVVFSAPVANALRYSTSLSVHEQKKWKDMIFSKAIYSEKVISGLDLSKENVVSATKWPRIFQRISVKKHFVTKTKSRSFHLFIKQNTSI